MTSLKSTTLAAVAALGLAVATFGAAGSAQAKPWFPPHPHHHHGGWGPAAIGLATGLVVGGIVASSQPSGVVTVYDDEPVTRCRRIERLNRWGEVIGWRRVCRTY